MICPLCKGDFPEDTFSEINDEGTKGCPRCIFLIALYIENGIKKHLTEGCLMPDRINARFRKILEEEFYPNPAATYKKYLAGMIDREEAELRIIYLPTAEIRKNAERLAVCFADTGAGRKIQAGSRRKFDDPRRKNHNRDQTPDLCNPRFEQTAGGKIRHENTGDGLFYPAAGVRHTNTNRKEYTK